MRPAKPRYPHAEQGARIKAARLHLGLTQISAAARISALSPRSVDQPHYSQWELGKYFPRYREQREALAKALDVELGWIETGAHPPDWYRPPAKHTHGGAAPETHHTKRKGNRKRREG